MTRPLAAAWLLIIAALLAAASAWAGPDLSAPRAPAFAGQRVQAAGPAADSTSVLDINGSGAIRLHNRFLAGGLLLYMAVMLGALVFLEKRRVAAAVILAAGVVVGGLLLVRGFG